MSIHFRLRVAKSHRHESSSLALTLVELLIVITILGILASVSMIAMRSFSQGQILSSNLDVIRNWLESTRRAALRGESCQISIANGLANESTSIISSTSSSGFNVSCNSPSSIQLESPERNRYYLFSVSSSNSPISTFSFTPRGTLFKSELQPAFSDDIKISLRLASSSGASQSDEYCLRLSSMMGNITQPSKANC